MRGIYMKAGDTVQIRRTDEADHWLYASVLDATTGRVQINHPGNVEDGKIVLPAVRDLRTKADVQSLIDQVTPILNSASPQHGLTHAQIRQLGTIDGFWLQYLNLDQKNQGPRVTMHRSIIAHYQSMMKQLS